MVKKFKQRFSEHSKVVLSVGWMSVQTEQMQCCVVVFFMPGLIRMKCLNSGCFECDVGGYVKFVCCINFTVTRSHLT